MPPLSPPTSSVPCGPPLSARNPTATWSPTSTSPSSALFASCCTRPRPTSRSSGRKKAPPTAQPAGCGHSTRSMAPPTTPTAPRCAPPRWHCSRTASPSSASSTPRSWPERYHAAEGHGAWTGDRQIHASNHRQPPRCHRRHRRLRHRHRSQPQERNHARDDRQLTSRVHRIRMLGTAAFDPGMACRRTARCLSAYTTWPWHLARANQLSNLAGSLPICLPTTQW
jgi:hypothetical protein